MPSQREQLLEKVAIVRRIAREEGEHMNRNRARSLAASWLTHMDRYITWSDPTGEQAVRNVIRNQAVSAA